MMNKIKLNVETKEVKTINLSEIEAGQVVMKDDAFYLCHKDDRGELKLMSLSTEVPISKSITIFSATGWIPCDATLTVSASDEV